MTTARNLQDRYTMLQAHTRRLSDPIQGYYLTDKRSHQAAQRMARKLGG